MKVFKKLNAEMHTTEENITFRILSAFGIVFVVMGHLNCKIFEFDSWFPYYSFHMALFAFISGYFYSSKYDMDVISFFIKKTKTILIPFYLISLFYLVLHTFLTHYGVAFGSLFSIYNWLIRPWIRCQPAGFNIATWYMIALYMAEIIYVIIRAIFNIISSSRLKDFLFFFFLLITAAMVIYYSPYSEEWQAVLLRPLFLCFFCHLGFCYRTYIENRFKLRASFLLTIVFICRLLLITLFGKCEYGLYGCDFNGLPWWVVIASSCLGITFWLCIAQLITPITSKDGIIVKIGRHTREIMAHHLFATFVFHGLLYFILKIICHISIFDISLMKNNLYFTYTPWNGFSLITVIISIGSILLAIFLKQKIIGIVRRFFNRE